MRIFTGGGLSDRLRALFPDREFIMRSQGQIRFINVSARRQMAAVGALAFLLIAWLGTVIGVAAMQYSSSSDQVALAAREARAAAAERRISNVRQDLDTTAQDLARRQAVIESMVEAHFGELPAEAGEAHAVSVPQATGQVSAALPEAARLAAIGARQFAFVEQLTQLADRRAKKAAQAIRALGLSPRAMMAALDDKGAQGGPLVRLTTSADGKLDSRFQRLGVSLARMSDLERGLAGIPQVQPASADYISSGFGYRSDPFTGEAALHAGLDFAGPMGAPIYAAAKGRVSFAGQRQGYGNCIEIDHGNGLTTRYAHMSAFRARPGQEVAAGTLIGAIGSTGRSTGPHLHFEVRVNDRPINPRPFLEGAPQASDLSRG